MRPSGLNQPGLGMEESTSMFTPRGRIMAKRSLSNQKQTFVRPSVSMQVNIVKCKVRTQEILKRKIEPVNKCQKMTSQEITDRTDKCVNSKCYKLIL